MGSKGEAMMELWELSARESIRELIAGYATNVDSGRFEDVVQLFAADGTLEPGGRPYTGHEKIRAMFARAGDSLANWPEPVILRHMTGSVTISIESPERASGRLYYAVFMGHGLDHWGHYNDTYCTVDGQWRFEHRKEFRDGVLPGGWADSMAQQISGS
jgi:hypothetical protein